MGKEKREDTTFSLALQFALREPLFCPCTIGIIGLSMGSTIVNLIAPPPVEGVFQHHVTKRTGNNFCKQCGPAMTELRVRQAELIDPGAKPVGTCRSRCYTQAERLIHRQS